jgi:hypothetical protein
MVGGNLDVRPRILYVMASVGCVMSGYIVIESQVWWLIDMSCCILPHIFLLAPQLATAIVGCLGDGTMASESGGIFHASWIYTLAPA